MYARLALVAIYATICFMSKVWKIVPRKRSDLIEQLLLNRGIKTEKQKRQFFNPELKDHKKELNIPGIDKAWQRVERAIKKGEQIIIYGDYDVDGVCGSAVLYKALSLLGAKVLPYIPHREKEGYGLSKEGLEYCRDSGATLVITVDHGIVALDQALYAKELGLDLIITDHHLPKDERPKAFSVVHSTLMCGTAVAWCLIRQFVPKALAEELLELVGIATVCDMMPLLGLNRFLVKEGLEKLNQTQSVGLKALFLEAGLVLGSVDAYSLGHVLGPRLNAIGRLEHAIDALRLLCTKDPIKAKKLATLLTEANLKRQEMTTLAVEQARLKIKDNQNIQVLHSTEWIPGIIGLIAGRITEETGRPAIAISVGEAVSRGSARSIDGVNIVEVIRGGVSDLLIDVGGHKGAAGFSLETAKLEEFKKRLEDLCQQMVTEEKVLEIEAEVTPKELTRALVEKLADFEPTGFGNPQPLLVSKKLQVSDVRTLSEGKHLKFRAEGIDCIAFGLGQMNTLVKNGQLVDLAFILELNRFNGRENLQLKVKDIKVV